MASSLPPAGYVVFQTISSMRDVPAANSQRFIGRHPSSMAVAVYHDRFGKPRISLGRSLPFSSIMQHRLTKKTVMLASENISPSEESLLNGSIASDELSLVPNETQGLGKETLEQRQPDSFVSSPVESSFPENDIPDASSVLNIEQLPSLVDAAPDDTIEQSRNSIDESLSNSQDQFSLDLKDIPEAIQNSVDNVVQAAQQAYADVNGSFLKTINNAKFVYEETVEGLKSSITEGPSTSGGTGDLSNPFSDASSLNNALKMVVVPIKSTLGSAVLLLKNLVSEGYSKAKELLPPDLNARLRTAEEYVDSVLTPLGKAAGQAYSAVIDFEKSLGVDPENPVIPVIVVVALGAVYLQSRYRGYGNLQPSAALDLLSKERNAVLIDIRPEELTESQGVPDLRRGTRSKFASVNFVKVENSVRRQLKNAGEIDSILTAAIIRNLKKVDSSTKVIVLDSDGDISKPLAKALKKAGVKKPFIVEGGFEAWKTSGLRSKPAVIETPFGILKEETEAIIEDVKPTPAGIILVLIGVLSGVKALIEWEKTLQLLGVIGISHAIYQRFSSYESVDDLKTDIRNLQKPFKLAVQGVLWVAGLLEPNKLQLATSPSTSAVQDKVIQAAAKHGSLPSEPGQEETPEEATDET